MKIFQSYMGTLSIQRPPMWASLRAGALPPAAEQSSADRCGGLWGSQSSDQLANKNIWSVLPWFRLSDEVQFPWTVVSWSLCGLLVFQNWEQFANKKNWSVLPSFKLSNEVQFPWTVVSWSLWRFAGLSELRAVLQAKNCLVFLCFNHVVHWRPIFLPGKKLGQFFPVHQPYDEVRKVVSWYLQQLGFSEQNFLSVGWLQISWDSWCGQLLFFRSSSQLIMPD